MVFEFGLAAHFVYLALVAVHVGVAVTGAAAEEESHLDEMFTPKKVKVFDGAKNKDYTKRGQY